jgi:DNA end-binding protein Ku
VREVIKKKAAGHKIEPKQPEKPSNVISLMDALKKSIAAERGHDRDEAPARRSASAKRSGSTKKSAARKPAKKSRKAG